MSARKIIVHLIGDSDSLEKAFRKSEKSGKGFGNSMSTAGSSLKTLGKAGAIGAAAGGVALLTKGLFSSISAAKEAEIAQTQLKQSLGSAGVSFQKYGKNIDAAIQKTSKLAGIDDEELSGVFSNLVRSTGSVAKATKGMALAANIARARNIPLATAAKAVEKAFLGSDLALRRVGVVVPKTTRAYDALKGQVNQLEDSMKGATDSEKAALQVKVDSIKAGYDAAKASDKQASSQSAIATAQRKFAGEAEAYGKTAAGAQDKLSVAWENLQEKLGAKLLPILTKVMLRLVDFIAWGEANWPKFSAAVEKVWARVKPVFEAFKSYLGGWVKLIQGIIQGDWSKAWAGVKQIVASAFRLVIEYLKAVPLRLVKLGLRMGKALADSFIEGMGNLAARIANKLIPGGPNTGGDKIPGGRTTAPPRTAKTPPYAGPRARGGPVKAGTSVRVGELGPEILTMGRRAGHITPNASSGISIQTVHVHGVQNVQQLLSELQRIGRHGVSQQRGRYGGSNLALG